MSLTLYSSQTYPLSTAQLDANWTYFNNSKIVSPKDYGAAGDGVTDDKAAMLLALQSGKVVDGGGLTYAINGTCAPTSLSGLQNAKFLQISDTSTSNANTLSIVGLSNFFIDNVNINMGSNVTTLFADDGNNGLYVAGSAYDSYIKNFKISRVTVTGNGCGTGIHVRHAKRFSVENCLVHDRVSGSSPDPTNDSQNGVQINNCANFTLSNTLVYNLQTRLSAVDSRKWTRGILHVECRDFSVTGCNVIEVDQGLDFSGAYVAATTYVGNRNWTISGCNASTCMTYGFKFANVTRDGLVTGCIATNTGLAGFVYSPSAVALPAGLEKYNTQNIDVVGCKVVNMLGTSWAGANAEGFRIMSNATYLDYPRGIRHSSCNVIDTQATPTTLHAFKSDVSNISYPTADYDTNIANTAVNCTASSNVTTVFDGWIGPNGCIVTGTSTQALADVTDAALLWDYDTYDAAGLHSTASNTGYIYIKTPGYYILRAQIVFTANATGIRRIRFVKNGSVIDRCTVHEVGTATINSDLTSSITTYLDSGDYVAVYGYQSSGGNLNLLSNESHFSVFRVDG